MKKLLTLFVICSLFGCTHQVKIEQDNVKQPEEKQEVVLQEESIKQNEYKEKQKIDLDTLFAFTYIQLKSETFPKEDLDLLNKVSIEVADMPEIILFMGSAREMGYPDKEIKNYLSKIPSRFVVREDCQKEIEYLKVFQTLTDNKGNIYGALANAKEKGKYEFESFVVFLPYNFRQADKRELLYDELKITPKETDCVVYYDTFTYTTRKEVEKTVPTVEILSSNIDENLEYLNWLKNLLEKLKEEIRIEYEKEKTAK